MPNNSVNSVIVASLIRFIDLNLFNKSSFDLGPIPVSLVSSKEFLPLRF